MIYLPKTVRRHMLQVANDQYMRPVSDAQMKEALKQYRVEMSIADIRREFDYLGSVPGPALDVHRVDDPEMEHARITPTGIDILTGAVNIDGVRPGDPGVENLAGKRDLRRGILALLNLRGGSYVEDVDIQDGFDQDNYPGVTLPEIRYHLWYLAGKDLVRATEIRVTANHVGYTARITSRGADVIAKDTHTHDAGVTSNGHEQRGR